MTSTPYLTIAKFGQKVQKQKQIRKNKIQRCTIHSIYDENIQSRLTSKKKSIGSFFPQRKDIQVNDRTNKSLRRNLFSRNFQVQSIHKIISNKKIKRKRIQYTQPCQRISLNVPCRQSVYVQTQLYKTQVRPPSASQKPISKTKSLLKRPYSSNRLSHNILRQSSPNLLTPWGSKDQIKYF